MKKNLCKAFSQGLRSKHRKIKGCWAAVYYRIGLHIAAGKLPGVVEVQSDKPQGAFTVYANIGGEYYVLTWKELVKLMRTRPDFFKGVEAEAFTLPLQGHRKLDAWPDLVLW